MCKYVLLQLSDLHFGKENQNSSDMRDQLKIDVMKQAVNQRIHYDALIISGDIIYGKTSNKKSAYSSATAYIKDIQERLCIPKTSTYVVPGNHDINIDDTQRRDAITDIRKTYRSRNGEITPANSCLLKPTEQFSKMYRQVTGRSYVPGHHLITKHKDIDFLCIDSSRTCTTSIEDYGKIILGMNDIACSLSGHSPNKGLVVIAHHKYDWLLESEKIKLLNTLSRKNTLLFCCGHIHSAEASVEKSLYTAGTSIAVSVAPTLMDDADEEMVMGYNIIHIDTDDGSVYVESFEWHDNNPHFSLNWRFPENHMYKEPVDDPLGNYVGLRVNSFELFLNRHARKLPISELAEATGIDKRSLEKYEKLNKKHTLDNMMIYPECKRSIDIVKLSYALHIEWRKLVASPDYWIHKGNRMEAYQRKKGVKPADMPTKRCRTKVVVFDFDGTLTRNATLRTSWERMWVSCGYPVERCRELHKEFSIGQFSHQEWCDKTAAAFKEKGFTRDNISEIAAEINLLDDCKEVIEHLNTIGVQLFIVSGSVDVLIKEVLGESIYCMFSKIQSNSMQFGQDGKLDRIIGTKYDFAGKAKYVEGIIEKGYKPSEIVFFGNSFNDESVCGTGVRSVCINPKQTRVYEPRYWTDEMTDVTSMKDFLKFIVE